MMCWIPGIKSFMHKCFVKMRVEKKRQVAPCQQLVLNVLTKGDCSAVIHYDRPCGKEGEESLHLLRNKKPIKTEKSSFPSVPHSCHFRLYRLRRGHGCVYAWVPMKCQCQFLEVPMESQAFPQLSPNFLDKPLGVRLEAFDVQEMPASMGSACESLQRALGKSTVTVHCKRLEPAKYMCAKPKMGRSAHSAERTLSLLPPM